MNNNYSLIVSGYTDTVTNKGIYFLELDSLGKIKMVKAWEHKENPSFLAYSGKNHELFVANEIETMCKVDRYTVNNQTLNYKNSIELPGSGLCHLLYNKASDKLYASCYGSGDVYCIDSTLETVWGQSRPNTNEQEPRAHCSLISNDQKRLITVDLGLNMLNVYDIERGKQFSEQLKQTVHLGEGTGPREIQLNEEANKLYVVNEHENTLGVYEWSSEGGEIMEEITRVETSFSKSDTINYPSSSILTNNRKWLLFANRGYNTISIFKIDKQGIPVLYKEYSCKGDWPRHMTLTSDEKFLLVANQKSHEISVFAYDQKLGKLEFTDKIEVANASCILENPL